MFLHIANNDDIKLIIVDNIHTNEKNILLEKIKSITDSSLLDRILFSHNENIGKTINNLANSNKLEHVFILGVNLNKHSENSGECALIIELKSKLKSDEIKVNVHQSAEIEDDSNIESVISFGNCSPNELETVWYSNMTDFEVSQILYKLNEINVKSKPNLINIDTVFGITEELSELLLISLAIEQTTKSSLPQLIVNSPSKYNSRVISKDHF